MEQINVLISGFAPYDGVDVNPSYEVPQSLAEQGESLISQDFADDLVDTRITINAVTLPVSFAKAWPTLLESIEATSANIVIATGLKREARGISLERCATNLMDTARPDADNTLPRRGPINPQGPAAYWTRLPLRGILKDFTDQEIPATLSSDAGTFVCNSLFYDLLHWSSQQPQVLAGFVSFPLVSESPHSQHGLTLAAQTAAGKSVVEQAIRYYRQPSSSEILLA